MKSIKNSVKPFARLSSALIIGLAILSETSFAGNCASIITNATATGAGCDCNDASSSRLTTNERDVTSGARTGNYGILQCLNAYDTVCNVNISIASINTTSPQYFKNTSGTDYFKCDWASGTGFSNGSIYVPTPPTPAPIDLHFSKQPETFATEINLK